MRARLLCVTHAHTIMFLVVNDARCRAPGECATCDKRSTRHACRVLTCAACLSFLSTIAIRVCEHSRARTTQLTYGTKTPKGSQEGCTEAEGEEGSSPQGITPPQVASCPTYENRPSGRFSFEAYGLLYWKRPERPALLAQGSLP